MTGAEWRRVGVLAAVVGALHVVGLLLLLLLVVPQHYRLDAGGVFGLGVGLTAYTLGVRHAFDADHLGAIDNTTRKLMAEGRRPLSVGFFFSLGHATVVLLLAVLVAVGVHGVGSAVGDAGSGVHQVTGLIGPAVSGSFLFLIGLLNLGILINIIKIVRRGAGTEDELEEQLARRGLMNRLFARATRAIRRPWQMYPLGFLFGLGFDTATEVALLVLAAGASPSYATICLPILFAAGMTLFDTISGVLMCFAYGWAFVRPARRAYYNIVITALSVGVALLIGTIELLAVLADRLHLSGGVWDLAAGVDLNLVGYAIAGLFALTWLVALAAWRVLRIEERLDVPRARA